MTHPKRHGGRLRRKGGGRSIREWIQRTPYVNRVARYVFHHVLAGYAAYARRRSPKAGDTLALVHDKWSGAVGAGSARTLCLFAHFDAAGRIDDYVLHYLRAIREQLGAETVVVSTAEHLTTDSVSQALPWVSEFAVRSNVGLDFGSWKVGLALRPHLSAYDRVILANDSVYGPIYPLAPIVAQLPKGRPAILGITDSYEVAHHLQSYFLCFNREVIASEFWKKFWEEFAFFEEKLVVIRQYEVGMSQRARRSGVELVAAFPYNEVERRARTMDIDAHVRAAIDRGRVNPTLFLWRALLEGLGCPFLKGELLRDNPHEVSDLGAVRAIVERTSDYPFALIREHLERIVRQRR